MKEIFLNYKDKTRLSNRYLLTSFGLSLGILLVISISSYLSIRTLLSSMDEVNTTHLIIKDLEGVMSGMKDAETGQRGYLITRDVEFLDDYNGASEKVMKRITRLEQSLKGPVHQGNIDILRSLATERLNKLNDLIILTKDDTVFGFEELRIGKGMMDDIRTLINDMKISAENNLITENSTLRQFSVFTPVLIVFAFLLAIIITIYFYIRLRRDLLERVRLEGDLVSKDEDVKRRIDLIQSVATRIAEGDYSVRVKDKGEDGLGHLSYALNQMAGNLKTSFEKLTINNWLQEGIAGFNECLIGEKNVERVTNKALAFITEWTGSQVGAFYTLESHDELHLSAGYALIPDKSRKQIKIGEGLVGQCALTGKEVLLDKIPTEHISISYASGAVNAVSLIVFPVFYESELKGVIEIGSLESYGSQHMEFMKKIGTNIGNAILSAQSHTQLQKLLEETRAQSLELQTQHAELENLNSQLETQTLKIQASEEELREANEELETRNMMLEEKNQIIMESNLKIKKTAEELSQVAKYKSEFLANMSHELRTPLNSILLLSRLLTVNATGNLTKDQQEYARVISTSGNSLLQLIDEILDLSKIEAGKMQLEYREVSIESIKNDMLDLFSSLAESKGIDFRIEIQNGTPEFIETDETRVEQVLKNLISNSIKFTQKGSVKLDIAQAESPDRIRFKVVDTGIGIPADKQKLIFEAFQQADGSTRRKYGGTGLGLSISREITRLLGGEISVESEEGNGSSFSVSIPVRHQEDQSSGRSPVMPKSVVENGQPYTKSEKEKTKNIATTIPDQLSDDRDKVQPGDRIILIIEDDIIFAETLMNYSREKGYRAIMTVRGDEALPMALQYQPAAILLDIVLPVKSGWEVMDDLKGHPSTRYIPVHIMSSIEAKKESLIKGAVDFINKPVAIDQMHRVFSKLEKAIGLESKKVLVIEENAKHAEALSYFLSNFNINSEVVQTIDDGVSAVKKEEVVCVILALDLPGQNLGEVLQSIKENAEMRDLPLIIFTGKNLSSSEEKRIRAFADSIVVKSAHSFERLLSEVGLFLHLVEEKGENGAVKSRKKMVVLNEVLEGKKVLVVDDDVRNIYAVTKMLEQNKMDVVSAVNGHEALKKLEENKDIDIVLMDMMMPEMDGYEAIAQIRKDERYSNMPILAVTARAMTGDRERCIQVGASDYISKPIDTDQLTSLLRVWLYGNDHQHLK